MKTHILVASLLLAISSTASALAISPISSNVGAGVTLANALVAPSGGVTIVDGSVFYQGTNTTSVQQSGIYSNFNLVPSSGSTATLSMNNGILLTSGSAVLPSTNTLNNTSTVTNSGSNAFLTTLSGTSTFDANVLSFNFTVAAGVTSVSAQFLFGSEEFPTQNITDIFGFFIDGVNYAEFNNGQLISNAPGGSTNFISNPVDGGLYGIGYNGLTQVFSVTGLLDGLAINGIHNLTIGIADTNDSIFDSGIFLSSLGISEGQGPGIENPNTVPEPTTVALLGLGLLGFAASRRKLAKNKNA